jgi:hypothetical protein
MRLFDRLFSGSRREARGPQAQTQQPNQKTQQPAPAPSQVRGVVDDWGVEEDDDAADTLRDPDVGGDFRKFDN